MWSSKMAGVLFQSLRFAGKPMFFRDCVVSIERLNYVYIITVMLSIVNTIESSNTH